MGIFVRRFGTDDWESVLAIYVEGIATGQATFETTPPSWERWDSSHLSFARLVAVSNDDGRLKGWAALSPISARAVYRGVAEVSVYVGNESRGLGVGRELLNQLIVDSEKHGIWTLQASIFPENAASIALHKNCGFREIGTRERVAKLNGTWRDTMLLERRSKVVGSD
jgi:L-amino acid N-acyltransferase YncA